MKKIGFLSFGHWTPAPHSEVRTASQALLQSIELAVAGQITSRFWKWLTSLDNFRNWLISSAA